MDQFYWKLEYGDFNDLKSVMIPPASVEQVKRRWEQGQPINLNTGSIPPNQIRSFEITDRPFGEVPRLAESAAQAFHEPIYHPVTGIGLVEEQAIEVRWVKKLVTRQQWEKKFSAIPGYTFLGEYNGMALVAFRVATHDIDLTKVDYCTEDEISQLTHN